MKQGAPFFSVVILAYQVKEYLEQCVNSVLRQSFPDYEVILVDPGSSDGTEVLCERYADLYEKVKVIHKKNEGQLLNRVAGFGIAAGEYLLCMDGDDWWQEDLLERLFADIQKEHAELLIFGHQRIKGRTVVRQVLHVFPHQAIFSGGRKKEIYEKLIQGFPINEVWAKAMSRKVFLRIPESFSDCADMRKGEDLLYSLYMVQYAENIQYIDLPMYNYRLRDGSVIHTFRPGDLEDMLRVKKHTEKMMHCWGLTQSRIYEKFYTSIARFLMDYIYRCCVSELPVREKKMLLRRIRTEELYFRTEPFQKLVPISRRVRLFAQLFRIGEDAALWYGVVYSRLKRTRKK